MTQGLLTFIDDYAHVLAKIIVGCDGFKLSKIKDKCIGEGLNILKIEMLDLVDLIRLTEAGCEDCLVIMRRNASMNLETFHHDELSNLYHDTFDIVGFNPRWKRGTADYNEVIVVKRSI